MSRLPEQLRQLINAYTAARQSVIDAGYWPEMHWMSKVSLTAATESDVLREAAWVILSSGMRDQVVRAKFGAISVAFRQWKSAETICKNLESCRCSALKVFGHLGKIDAIVSITSYIRDSGVDHFKHQLLQAGPDFLLRFAYLGPATSRHLAKNLGLAMAKPDRHLIRIASAAGFESVDSLCQKLADTVGEQIAVVDLVLWRYATLDTDYVSTFVTCERSHAPAAA